VVTRREASPERTGTHGEMPGPASTTSKGKAVGAYTEGPVRPTRTGDGPIGPSPASSAGTARLRCPHERISRERSEEPDGT
jgi:hypothetical protein